VRILIIRDHEIPIIRDALLGAEIALRETLPIVREDTEKRDELEDALRIILKTRDKIPLPPPPTPGHLHRPLIP
jgi:hypothetical protein